MDGYSKSRKKEGWSRLLVGAALALLELYALSGISMAKEPGEWEVQNISEHPEEETGQIGETQIFDDIEENGQIIIADMGMLPAKKTFGH